MPNPNNIVSDISRFSDISKANVEMMKTMHSALSSIARCEVSRSGGIAQKHIAETALVTVHTIANQLEVKKCQY